MPKIHLKPNSPEYNDSSAFRKETGKRRCDMPGCDETADHRAPKDRNLSDYYKFCLEHVQEYNKAWNYFSGMSLADIEDYINRATTWDRPTQRYDTMANFEKIQNKAWKAYNFSEEEPPKNRSYAGINRNTPEFEALVIMGLEPPLNLDKIKDRYRTLAKKYHPDLNRGDREAEELLKRINMAYTVLKMACQKFESLPDN